MVHSRIIAVKGRKEWAMRKRGCRFDRRCYIVRFSRWVRQDVGIFMGMREAQGSGRGVPSSRATSFPGTGGRVLRMGVDVGKLVGSWSSF